MSKKFAVIFILAAFLIGVWGGSIGANHIWGKFFNRFAATGQLTQAGLCLPTLNRLRTNHVADAIELVENELDGALIGFGTYVDHDPHWHPDSTQRNILRMAREYRARYPRRSLHPEIDRAVSKTLALADAPAKSKQPHDGLSP